MNNARYRKTNQESGIGITACLFGLPTLLERDPRRPHRKVGTVVLGSRRGPPRHWQRLRKTRSTSNASAIPPCRLPLDNAMAGAMLLKLEPGPQGRLGPTSPARLGHPASAPNSIPLGGGESDGIHPPGWLTGSRVFQGKSQGRESAQAPEGQRSRGAAGGAVAVARRGPGGDARPGGWVRRPQPS
jgi:hypothetical protein